MNILYIEINVILLNKNQYFFIFKNIQQLKRYNH